MRNDTTTRGAEDRAGDDLGYDVGQVEIINVRTVGLASQFSVASNDTDGRLRLGLFSTGALEGSGEILSIEIDVSGDSIGEAFTIDAAANEGEIPLRIGTPRRYDRDRQPPVPRDRRTPREIGRQ